MLIPSNHGVNLFSSLTRKITYYAHRVSHQCDAEVGQCQVHQEVLADLIHGPRRLGNNEDDDVSEGAQHERHAHKSAVNDGQVEPRMPQGRHIFKGGVGVGCSIDVTCVVMCLEDK